MPRELDNVAHWIHPVDRQLSNRAQGLPLRFNGGTPHSWMFDFMENPTKNWMIYHGLSWFIMDDNWGTIYGNLHISPPGLDSVPHATVPAQPSPSDFPRQQLLEDSNSA